MLLLQIIVQQKKLEGIGAFNNVMGIQFKAFILIQVIWKKITRQ